MPPLVDPVPASGFCRSTLAVGAADKPHCSTRGGERAALCFPPCAQLFQGKSKLSLAGW